MFSLFSSSSLVDFKSSLLLLIYSIISSYYLTIFSSLIELGSFLDPTRSSSLVNSNFSIINYSSVVHVSFNLCYKLNLSNTLYMISVVNTASEEPSIFIPWANAASCHAITIFVISLPENPSVF